VLHQHMIAPDHIKINKDLGLVIHHELCFSFASVGPENFYEKMFNASKYPDRLIAPIPLYLEEGIPFSLNTDGGGINTHCSVWSSVYIACNRKNWPGWGDEYSISREEALSAITMGGAYKLGMEDRIGSIEVGKLADLTVLSEDPFTCDLDKVSGITSEKTIVGGRIVYER
jgi:predicted amidohydrolase YtcJ